MADISPLTWVVGLGALVLGILAGHFGWGRRWPGRGSRLHPDYLTGLDYLVTEQPDRALDMFLKLMDANADTVETHFALGSLYRRRGEVERAIRIHQNLLARADLAPEHREQALLAMAQDYLRAGLLDRAEGLFQQVSEVPRLRASALDALRGIYERQNEWPQALETYRQLVRIKAAPPRTVAAHYQCELAAAAAERGEFAEAHRLLREAGHEAAPFPRADLLRSRVAEQEGDRALAAKLQRSALSDAPQLLIEELPRLLELTGPAERDRLLGELVEQASARDFAELKRLVFAALAADLASAAPLRAAVERVFKGDAALAAMLAAGGGDLARVTREVGALMSGAEKYRCNECGFAARSFYWHCPACHAWDGFENHAIVTLR